MKLGPLAVPGYHVGDCRELLAALPDDCIDCVVTSPPYWALRDYGLPSLVWGGDAACIHRWGPGLKQHRGGPSGNGVMLEGGRSVVAAHELVKDIDAGAFCETCGAWRGQLGLEPTPESFVEHLVEVLRGVHRVLKPEGTLWLNLGDSYAASSTSNHGRGKATPSLSGRGRAQPAGGWENPPRRAPGPWLKAKDLVGIPWRMAFALQADGWWLRSDIIWHKPNPMPESVTDRPTKAHEYLFLLTKGEEYFYDAAAIKEPVTGRAHLRGDGVNPKARGPKDEVRAQPGLRESTRLGRGAGFRVKQNASFAAAVTDLVDKRNKRSVWTISTEPTPDAHFATFPRKLVEPCILAGCPVGGVVLDPFGGAGTVGRVAEDHGRRWLLFDLSASYAAIAKRKTAQTGLLVRAAGGAR